jgi:hypothetical protein
VEELEAIGLDDAEFEALGLDDAGSEAELLSPQLIIDAVRNRKKRRTREKTFIFVTSKL